MSRPICLGRTIDKTYLEFETKVAEAVQVGNLIVKRCDEMRKIEPLWINHSEYTKLAGISWRSPFPYSAGSRFIQSSWAILRACMSTGTWNTGSFAPNMDASYGYCDTLKYRNYPRLLFPYWRTPVRRKNHERTFSLALIPSVMDFRRILPNRPFPKLLWRFHYFLSGGFTLYYSKLISHENKIMRSY